MNVDLPTPVSPITRKCFDSSLRRMRRNLSRVKSKPLLLSRNRSVELRDRHAFWSAQLLSLASSPPPAEVEGSTSDKKNGRNAGPNNERDCDQIAGRLAVVDGCSQPLGKDGRLYIDEAARKAGDG